MNGRPHPRRRAPRTRLAAVDANTVAALLVIGCTCAEVEVVPVEHHADFWHREVRHDPDCPALASGPFRTISLLPTGRTR